MKVLNNLDLSKNELQNALLHKLASAPSSPTKGQCYFNTTDNKAYIYNGNTWLDITWQGEIYKFGEEFENTTEVNLKLDNSGNVALSKSELGIKGNVANATSSAAGVVKLATDAEVTTGTSTTTAVTPKQLADTANKKVTANSAITGATKTKITYDSKGLITAGADLTASDIPSIPLSKISDVTASATEVNYVKGVTSAIQTQLNAKQSNTPNGTNPLLTNNKINSVYLPDYLLGQLLYGGTVTGAGVATLSTNAKTKLGSSSDSITLTNNATATTGYTANNGIYYIVSSDGNFAGLSLQTGDWLIATGSSWAKIDNTDAVMSVNGKLGTVVLTTDDISAGSTNLYVTASEKSTWNAKQNAITSTNKLNADLLTAGSTNTVYTITEKNKLSAIDSGAQVNVLEGVQVNGTDVTLTNKKFNLTAGTNVSMSASGNTITIAATSSIQKYAANNPALTQSSGLCTWTITHNLNTTDVTVTIKEASTGELILADVIITNANTVTVKIVSASNISSGTYRAVIIG